MANGQFVVSRGVPGSTCPTCRFVVTPYDLRRALPALKIRCVMNSDGCSTHLTVEELDTHWHTQCQFVTECCACGTELLRQHPDLNMSDVTNPCQTIQMANGQFVVSHAVPGSTCTCTQYFDLLSVSIHWRNCNWSTKKDSVCLIPLLLFLCRNLYTSHCVCTIIIPSRITDRSATILLLWRQKLHM